MPQHPIDHLEARRREIVAALRERIVRSGIPRHTLAVRAGLADRALKRFDQDGWDPKAETIRKLDTYLDTLAEDRSRIRPSGSDCKGPGGGISERPSDVAA